MVEKFRILGIVGSLRKGSYNKTLMHAAIEVAPENVEIETFDIEQIPLFNQDLESQASLALTRFKEKIRAADAILIATPEYNYGVPGILKNAIDAASRPYGDNAWKGKPVAIMSASIGRLGGGRAQYHLRQSFVFLDMHPVNMPEVMLAEAAKNVDENGRLTNQVTRDLIKQLIKALVDWTKKLQSKPQTPCITLMPA
jgi:chromate reductase, NAD(P)H dehydrogenase (quinone)